LAKIFKHFLKFCVKFLGSSSVTCIETSKIFEIQTNIFHQQSRIVGLRFGVRSYFHSRGPLT